MEGSTKTPRTEQKARQVLDILKAAWSSSPLTKENKTQLFNINLKSVLLHCSKTWRSEWYPKDKRKVGRPMKVWRGSADKEIKATRTIVGRISEDITEVVGNSEACSSQSEKDITRFVIIKYHERTIHGLDRPSGKANKTFVDPRSN
ncbi:hypothetical protein CHS0354_038080 [Potamilus streckersoni]|uniref:Uncharacterized protein n=1 Tax=Potamilus streckersoni TaxID=2493646 RepID=A0AAE0W1M7_9BIVA|nr:hypothetical protein CHS0354_038080 [Potamilus streckersoni]